MLVEPGKRRLTNTSQKNNEILVHLYNAFFLTFFVSESSVSEFFS